MTTAVTARRFVSLVKFEHTIFALPFAFVGAMLSIGEVPSAATLGWVTLAMVGARSLAMALNRLIDAEIDARNPRTAAREIPSGLLSNIQVLAFCGLALAVFLFATWQLDPVVRWLWPIPVLAFVLYPYTKRFTWLCHLALGLATGLAPIGAWLAVSGDADLAPFLLWFAVALWIGGFDVIYATTLGGPNDATTNLHIMAYQYSFQWYQMGKGMAQAIVLLLLVVIVSYLLMRLWNRASESTS